MDCPVCGSQVTHVITTNRPTPAGIKRRRKCPDCGLKFTTQEAVLGPMVRKRVDRPEEPFSLPKLTQAIHVVCYKRDVNGREIELLAAEIRDELLHRQVPSVSSNTIAQMVIRRLRRLDDVAWLRFAASYLSPTDLGLSQLDRFSPDSLDQLEFSMA